MRTRGYLFSSSCALGLTEFLPAVSPLSLVEEWGNSWHLDVLLRPGTAAYRDARERNAAAADEGMGVGVGRCGFGYGPGSSQAS